MGQVIGYGRRSTADQQQSLDIQAEQLRAAGCSKIFSETISGAAKVSPELERMIEYCREGDTVVACRLDRLARSTTHLLQLAETLEAKGVSLQILNIPGLDTRTANGRLLLTLLGAVEAFERDLMIERQREGIARAKEAGRYKGRKPTARAKADQVKALADQGMTKQAIADQLGIGVASVYRVLAENFSATLIEG